MPRSLKEVAKNRTFTQLADERDLRSVIVSALAASPIYEQALRRGVWTYVSAERAAGTAPGRIILTLTELVDEARVTPLSVRHALTHQTILWCVEAYFGRLGGSKIDRRDDLRSDAPGLA